MKTVLDKYSHAWTLLYIFLYFPWFYWLEQRNIHYTIINIPFDNIIPFCEYFSIPYFLWFFYVPVVTLLILFKGDKEEFYKYTGMLFIGMTVCLLICTFWPNGQTLRVNLDVNKNIFTNMIATLYQTDTSTNVFPSIHVYNSLVCHIALCKNKLIKDKKFIKSLSFLLMFSICLSTMFLKQHSIIDVLGSLFLCGIMYSIIYQPVLIKSNKFLTKPIPGYEDSSSNSSR